MHTVIVVLEAAPNAVEQLKENLLNVAKLSREEPGNIDYFVHQDKNNACIFVLYENWDDEATHLKQFEKPYIKEFATKAQGWLAKPYDAYFVNKLEQ